jgi:hypothetical protein
VTGDTASMGETTGRPGGGGAPRPRRELLAVAAAALGVLTAETVASATPAQATQGSAVIEGQDNTGATSRTGVFTTGNTEFGILADPNTSGNGSLGVYGHGQTAGVLGEAAGNGIGVVGTGGGIGAGVEGIGGSPDGNGVVGQGSGAGQGLLGIGGSGGEGVRGVGGGSANGVTGIGGITGGNGVDGRAVSAAGAGVLAENTAGGNALRVAGPAAFSRSGILTVAAGSSSATKTGVPLTSASLVLATLQQNLAGVYVRSAVPNVAGSSFTIHLSKAVTVSTRVAWFVVN